MQATRWDDLGFTAEFIRKISNRSNLVAHQLIWNMDVNMYRDEDGTDKDPIMYKILESLRSTIGNFFTIERKKNTIEGKLFTSEGKLLPLREILFIV